MLRENWSDAGPGFHPVSSSDYLPAAQLRDLQLRRLQSMVGRAYAHVPLFRGRMDVRGLTPASITDFARRRPDWPSVELMRRRAEQALSDMNLSPTDEIAAAEVLSNLAAGEALSEATAKHRS